MFALYQSLIVRRSSVVKRETFCTRAAVRGAHHRPGGLFAEDPFQAIRRNLDIIEAGFPAREVSRFS